MKAPALNPAAWPLTLKVPLLVAVLIVSATAIASNIVLMRISETQKTNLQQLTGSYLDGLSTALMPHVIRKDIWETFDTLDRTREQYEGVHVLNNIVALNDGSVLAASDPRAFPVLSPVPEKLTERFPNGEELVIDDVGGRAWTRRTLKEGNVPVGSIFVEIDISDLLRERHEVLVTLIVVNSLLTLIFVAFGYVMARRMVRPLSVLTAYVEHVRKGKMELIPPRCMPAPGTEFGDLFRRFNAMAQALNEREALAARLAEEEKMAQLGRLASGMAHEVNNPLGGMMNAVDTLHKHGDEPEVRTTSLDLLRRGLTGIRNVVRAALVTYKGVPDPHQLGRRDLDDLRFLVQHEIRRRRLRLLWLNDLPDEVSVDGEATRQAALNLILNACAASPAGGVVRVEARREDGALHITIADDGPGLPETVAALFEEASVDLPPPKGITGLGTWAAAHLVARMNGRFQVTTAAQGGTRLTMVIPLRRKEKLVAAA